MGIQVPSLVRVDGKPVMLKYVYKPGEAWAALIEDEQDGERMVLLDEIEEIA